MGCPDNMVRAGLQLGGVYVLHCLLLEESPAVETLSQLRELKKADKEDKNV